MLFLMSGIGTMIGIGIMIETMTGSVGEGVKEIESGTGTEIVTACEMKRTMVVIGCEKGVEMDGIGKGEIETEEGIVQGALVEAGVGVGIAGIVMVTVRGMVAAVPALEDVVLMKRIKRRRQRNRRKTALITQILRLQKRTGLGHHLG